jgi:hypothetical protein
MKVRNALAWGLGLAMASATAASAVAQASPWPWSPQEPQGSFTQTWHNGFRAGEDAANQDLNTKTSPDLGRHSDYRNPDLAPVATEEFQEGFRFAYQAVVDFRLHHVSDPNNVASDYGHSPSD